VDQEENNTEASPMVVNNVIPSMVMPLQSGSLHFVPIDNHTQATRKNPLLPPLGVDELMTCLMSLIQKQNDKLKRVEENQENIPTEIATKLEVPQSYFNDSHILMIFNFFINYLKPMYYLNI